MTEIVAGRMCAEVEKGIVIFLIGVRINRLWKIWKWLPVVLAMPRMLQELAARPELGMLSARGHFGVRNAMVVQYWRSAKHLRDYAHATDHAHLPAWQAFNRATSAGEDVGIWHETYVVPAGHAESVFVNMPRYGLGLVAPLFPAKGGRATAAKRLSGVATMRDVARET